MSGESKQSDAAGALIETLHLLWPDADAVTLTRSRRTSRAGHHLIAIPNAASPRLLVPLENRAAASRAMRRFSASLSVKATAERLAGAAALRVGGAALFADRFSIDHRGDDALSDHLAEIFGRPVTFSIGVGTARVNRKPILQVFDERGHSLAFVKVATGQESQVDVRGEATALERLGTREWETMEIPRLIHRGEWRGLFLLVITSLHTRARQPKRAGPPIRAMDELARSFDEGAQRLDEAPWWDRTIAQAELIPDPEQRRAYQFAAERLADLAGARRRAIGAWHGDWTSWNMAWRGERVQVWDWERFQTGVPVGLDRYHYYVNDSVVLGGGDIAAAIDRGLRTAGAAPEDREQLVSASSYLLTMASRYLPAAHRDGGHLIRERSVATLEVLDRWLS